MKTMQLREAKAKLSALVAAAENGESTVVTKNGRPAAMVVPFDKTRRRPGTEAEFCGLADVDSARHSDPAEPVART